MSASVTERIVECRVCGVATRPRKCGSHRCAPCEAERVREWLARQPVETEPKACRLCGVVKPLTDFPSGGAGRKKNFCKECRPRVRTATSETERAQRQAKEKHRYATDPEYREFRKASERARRYGITPERIEQMLAAQGGRCAICKSDNPGVEGRFWHVDHDHSCCPESKSCGKCVRALLCSGCNVGLGAFKDNPAALRAAANYLEGFRG